MNGAEVPTVQRWRGLAAAGLTLLALGLVLVVLTTPRRLDEMSPSAFLRLPVELLVLLALLLVLPDRARRVRGLVVAAAGLLLAVLAVFELLDLGFGQALNRPFDPMIDWRYAGDLVDTVRGSAPGVLGVVLLAVAGVVLVAALPVVPLALLRVCRVALRHRPATARAVAVLLPAWLVLSLLGVRAGPVPVASDAAASYAVAQVARVPSQLRDQREFARSAAEDPARDTPAADLLTGLRGKDVLVVFVESYGRVALDDPGLSPDVVAALDDATRRLGGEGYRARSAWLTSPTFGAISWLAHATLQSGLWVDSQQRYDHLVTTDRETLSSLFGRAGWRTVASVPANDRDWPQGAFYGFDHVYDSRNVGYRGPRFGYPTMPDQFTLEAFQQAELAPHDRRPVMAEIDLISSHAPWSRTPDLLPQESVGDGSVYDGMPETLPSEADIWPDADRVRAAYADAIAYSLRSVTSFLSTYADDDLVVVLLGDHQPATIVSGASGHDPGHDVPVTVLSRDPEVIDALGPRGSDWGWDPGLRPSDDAPVWRMDAFRDELLRAYGPGGHTVTARAVTR
ncbi:CDP-alcohol phosphatidyltransferase family protein [Nocardioides sp. STR2]|uniref:CDP-alcohol phosphatidyltransferase family protein n=1 Tax=Nocardioides pini TaxID=2975053 RepID=A0ABT4CC43_9ACTN|nr:sulfatase-like hydrolase/transferase [Nocardioides pini]MCY4726523.1 CDP-alcohol phosphatidyltransferase family protein [Nocardioides pini]